MNKREFLARLRRGLSGIPRDDIEERLIFYSEMIDDRMEEGLSETEAVASIGTVDEVVSQILADTPLTRPVNEKTRPGRHMRAWEIVLLVLGFPVWLPLLIAAFAVILAVFIVIWSAVISLWAVEASLCAGALGGAISALTAQGNGNRGIVMLSVGLCCAGLTIFLFFGCKAVTKGSFKLTKGAALRFKSLFVGREAA